MVLMPYPYRGRLTWPLRIVRLIGLVLLLISATQANEAPGWSGRSLLITVLLVLTSIGWLLWLAADWRGERWRLVGVVLVGVPGGLLAGLNPVGTALVFPCLAMLDAGFTGPYRRTVAIGAATVGAMAAGRVVTGWHHFALQALLVFACAVLGALRGAYQYRADQEELVQSNVQIAAQEQARAATLAERARVARELHDLQAHALSALAVQLKVIEALVDERREPERIRPYLAQAHDLAREGLVETRRAILALREEELPLACLLSRLADTYRDRDGAPAHFEVTGEPANLAADVALTTYRAGQEAFTNVRRHAEGSPVWMTLAYSEQDVRLTVVNELARTPAGAVAARGGYGLAGLRERAEMVSGQLTVGPSDGRWRASLSIPLSRAGR
ncbi:histidine kinase [Actinoplanes sp. KI2]|uniref:sensor histidine kinase n=1 Tax=Actinoplanes sp. KI2 TaxID=2983315 RepID=UPI0021D5C1BC|nr:histidine kinase [Actinoplanes sp. KI2]MCU7728480.1 histidine kinase [Actinoplanes sp. KI2]